MPSPPLLCHRANVTDSADEQIRKAIDFKKQQDDFFHADEFRELEKDVFPQRPEVEELLDKCRIFQIAYRKMWPRDCTEDVIKLAEERDDPIHTMLYLDVRIPEVLLHTTEPTGLELWVDIHGGGGFTGAPSFIPWTFKALLEYQVRKQNIVVASPSYPLLGECDGTDILENNSDILSALFKQLQPALHKHNSNLYIAWDNFNVTSVSFGCGLALDMIFRKLKSHAQKPTDLRVRKMLMRSCLSKTYARDEGLYMGKFIPREEAEAYSQGMALLFRSECLKPRQAGINPSSRMLGAYASAVSRVKGTMWIDFWACPTVFELLEQDGTFPNDEVCVVFVHGAADFMVKIQDARDQMESLRARFPSLKIQLRVEENEGHAFDYDKSYNDYREEFAS